MIALKVQRNVAKGIRIAIDVQRPHVASSTAIVMQLLAEEMRKVRGCI
jgi:hypothetical protein